MRKPAQLRAALHRRRDRRRSDRGGARARGAGPAAHARSTSARASRTLDEADAATREYLERRSTRSIASGIERNISLKLTQLGLDVDRATARRQPAHDPRARRAGGVLRPHRHGELAVHRRHARDLRDAVAARATGRSASCCSRRCIAREQDVARMNALGARVRLVKGAYKEPKAVAYQQKADVDAAYVRMMKTLLDRRHLSGDRDARSRDDRAARSSSRASTDIGARRFEFQMLYGIRRDLQSRLAEGRLPRARLRAVRPRVVSLFHAPPRRAAGAMSCSSSARIIGESSWSADLRTWDSRRATSCRLLESSRTAMLSAGDVVQMKLGRLHWYRWPAEGAATRRTRHGNVPPSWRRAPGSRTRHDGFASADDVRPARTRHDAAVRAGADVPALRVLRARNAWLGTERSAGSHGACASARRFSRTSSGSVESRSDPDSDRCSSGNSYAQMPGIGSRKPCTRCAGTDTARQQKRRQFRQRVATPSTSSTITYSSVE